MQLAKGCYESWTHFNVGTRPVHVDYDANQQFSLFVMTLNEWNMWTSGTPNPCKPQYYSQRLDVDHSGGFDLQLNETNNPHTILILTYILAGSPTIDLAIGPVPGTAVVTASTASIPVQTTSLVYVQVVQLAESTKTFILLVIVLSLIALAAVLLSFLKK